jgi:hypothetical protein
MVESLARSSTTVKKCHLTITQMQMLLGVQL